MASSYHDLVTRARLDTADFERGAKRAERAMDRMKKKSGSANQTIIELGRGVSDARFGFHGLANNAERMTELFANLTKNAGGFRGALGAIGKSLLGPAGVILAVTTLIAYGPQIVQFFKDLVAGQNSAARSAEELNKKLREQAGLLPKTDPVVEKGLDEIKKLNKELQSLEGRRQLAIETTGSVPQRLLNQIEQVEQARAAILETLKQHDLNKQAEKDKKKARQEAKIDRDNTKKDLEEQKEIIESIRVDEAVEKLLGSPFSAAGADAQQSELLKARRGLKFKDYGDGITDVSDVQVIDEEDFETFGDFGDEAAKNSKKVTKAFDDIGLAASAAGALVGTLANAIAGTDATPLEAAAASIISTLASIAIAAAVAGASQSAAATGPAAIFTLPTFIALALGAVAAALAAGGGKASSAGGRARGGSGATPSPSVTPSKIQGIGEAGQLVAKVRGQDLRFVLQGANDTYNARN